MSQSSGVPLVELGLSPGKPSLVWVAAKGEKVPGFLSGTQSLIPNLRSPIISRILVLPEHLSLVGTECCGVRGSLEALTWVLHKGRIEGGLLTLNGK